MWKEMTCSGGGGGKPDFGSALAVGNSRNTEPFLTYSSKISNLFARDEMDEITQGLISVMKRELPRHPPTFDNLYEYFISRSRKNLHVVLCFSPVSFYFSYFYVGGVTSLNVLSSPSLMRWFAQKWTLVTSWLPPISTDQNHTKEWKLSVLISNYCIPYNFDYLETEIIYFKGFGDIVFSSFSSNVFIPSRMSLM